MNRHPMALALPVLLLAMACGTPETGEGGMTAPPADGPLPRIAAVNYPLAYFAERIGGDRVMVELPVPPDIDPAFWSPSPEAIGRFQEADSILLNGAGYARWVNRATLPPEALLDTSAAFRDRLIPMADAPVHSHGPEGEHSHGAIAFTVWLDPALALAQAAAIRDRLVELRPGDAAAFLAGYDALETDLLSLDRDLAAVLGRLGDAPLLASHPVYQYLARRYRLRIESVHFEPGTMPDERAWEDLLRLHAEHPARWMLWEAEPGGAIRDRLLAVGIDSVVLDPCGNRPAEGDYLGVMRGNVENLRSAIPASSARSAGPSSQPRLSMRSARERTGTGPAAAPSPASPQITAAGIPRAAARARTTSGSFPGIVSGS
jgi:zinc transport system substrate-binding protein